MILFDHQAARRAVLLRLLVDGHPAGGWQHDTDVRRAANIRRGLFVRVLRRLADDGLVQVRPRWGTCRLTADGRDKARTLTGHQEAA